MKHTLLMLALGLSGAVVAAESTPPPSKAQAAPVASSPASAPSAPATPPAPVAEPVNLEAKCREAAQQQKLSPVEQEVWLSACLADAAGTEIVDEPPPVSTVRPPLR